MQIPTGWHYLTTDLNGKTYEHTTSAFLRTEDFLLQVTHTSRDMTTFHVYEPDAPESFDFAMRSHLIEWGSHRSPREAFAFAEAYAAGTAEFRPERRFGVSARYSATVSTAYAR